MELIQSMKGRERHQRCVSDQGLSDHMDTGQGWGHLLKFRKQGRREVPVSLDQEMTQKHIEKYLVCCKCEIYFWLFFFLDTIFSLFLDTKRKSKVQLLKSGNRVREFQQEIDVLFGTQAVGLGSFIFLVSGGWNSLSYGRGLISPGSQITNYHAGYFLQEAREQIVMLDIFSGHRMASVGILLWKKKNKSTYQMVYPCCPINH